MAYNKKEVLQANTEAIRVVLRLEKERREATETEKSILRNYQGFGGLKCVLNRTDNPDDIRYWSKSEQNLFEPTQQLKQMIYREAVDAKHRQAVLGGHQGKRTDLLLYRYPYRFCHLRRTCLHKPAGKTMLRPFYGYGCLC